MIKTMEEIQTIIKRNKFKQQEQVVPIYKEQQKDNLKHKFNREEYDKNYRKSDKYKSYQKKYREDNKEKARQRYLKKKEEQND